MTRPELAHLELLCEVDSLSQRLECWADDAPRWEPAQSCRALVRRLLERTRSLRRRLEGPLVVAVVGGTGVGKSALVNALVGAQVVATGRQRPTTRRPTLICRPELTPEMLGIDPHSVELPPSPKDLPALAGLVLIDCPDPDTTEQTEAADTNLARLRGILPYCDVLLVATTQQKYRSARVSDELAAAASGARLVFVQTHAAVDEDIRDDWRGVLEDDYTTGKIFLVDSLEALADAQNGLKPRGEFAELVDLLTRQLGGTAPVRIRRANFLDLVGKTLDACRERIDEGLPAVRQLQQAIDQQRKGLAAQLADRMRSELLASRRQWENRLVGQVASRWGFSPFALVLRLFHGLGGLLTSALLLRVRTPAQAALWGAVEGARSWRKHRRNRQADAGATRAVAGCWDGGTLRSAALILDGYTAEAGLNRQAAGLPTINAEAVDAGQTFVADVSAQLQSLIDRLAQRHTGWFTRWRYELLLAVMLGILLYRLGKNFFWDSWLAPQPVPPFGLDFYLSATFWLVLWCVVLLWAFTSRLRRGLRRQIDELAQGWSDPRPAGGIFAQLESECRHVDRLGDELARLQQQVSSLGQRLTAPDEPLGRRR